MFGGRVVEEGSEADPQVAVAPLQQLHLEPAKERRAIREEEGCLEQGMVQRKLQYIDITNQKVIL
jgi:hypothetical protein